MTESPMRTSRHIVLIDPDCDSDGINDGSDNCIEDPNVNQENSDGDLLGDACDDDDDDDDTILDDSDNCRIIANFDQTDQDCDGIGDLCDSDRDGDGLDAAEEVQKGTDPTSADTDADGLSDGPLNPESNPGCENTYDPLITGINDPNPTVPEGDLMLFHCL